MTMSASCKDLISCRLWMYFLRFNVKKFVEKLMSCKIQLSGYDLVKNGRIPSQRRHKWLVLNCWQNVQTWRSSCHKRFQSMLGNWQENKGGWHAGSWRLLFKSTCAHPLHSACSQQNALVSIFMTKMENSRGEGN